MNKTVNICNIMCLSIFVTSSSQDFMFSICHLNINLQLFVTNLAIMWRKKDEQLIKKSYVRAVE